MLLALTVGQAEGAGERDEVMMPGARRWSEVLACADCGALSADHFQIIDVA